MQLANPKINGAQTSIQTLLDGLPRQASGFRVTGTIPLPPWDGVEYHFQGIAPYNGALLINIGFITASSTMGYFASFQPDAGGTSLTSVQPTPGYYHAAGCQMLGNLLAVPWESEYSDEKGYVGFYDVSDPSRPLSIYSQQMPGKKASAAAITSYTDAAGNEQALLMVYEYDHHQMYIYTAPVSSLAGHHDQSPFTYVKTYSGDALDTRDQFQCFALAAQTTATGDQVYLLGFREDEELWLYNVNLTPGSGFGDPSHLTTYKDWRGSDWRNGVGLQITSPSQVRLYGTAQDPSGSSNYPGGPANYSFDLYVYTN